MKIGSKKIIHSLNGWEFADALAFRGQGHSTKKVCRNTMSRKVRRFLKVELRKI